MWIRFVRSEHCDRTMRPFRWGLGSGRALDGLAPVLRRILPTVLWSMRASSPNSAAIRSVICLCVNLGAFRYVISTKLSKASGVFLPCCPMLGSLWFLCCTSGATRFNSIREPLLKDWCKFTFSPLCGQVWEGAKYTPSGPGQTTEVRKGLPNVSARPFSRAPANAP